MFQYLVLFIHSSNETIKEYKRRKHHQAAYGHGGFGFVGVVAYNKYLPHGTRTIIYLFILAKIPLILQPKQQCF